MTKATQATNKTNSKNQQDTGMAALAYILFFVPLLTESKDDPFVRFHVKQGLVLFILFVGASIISIIPFIGWVISMVAWIVGLILLIIGITNAVNEEQKPLPVIGQYADKFNL